MKKMLLIAMAILLVANPVRATPYANDIRVSDDFLTLKKVYELDYGSEPIEISKEKFEMYGYSYTFVDFLVEEIKGEEIFWAIEPVEFYSATSNIESIVSKLEKEIEVDYENGFNGKIPLNISSIKVKSLGTGTTTKNTSKTVTYPNLSSADLTYIPKTYDGLNLTNVQWQSDNTATIDHHTLTDRYSCIATYGGTTTSTYSKGYTVTAEYQGELRKEVIEKVKWTAVFNGRKQFNWWALSPLGAIPICGVAYFILKKKGRTKNEKNYLS